MGLVDCGLTTYPTDFAIGDGFSLLDQILDETTTKHAFILQAPKTGNIRKVGFTTGSVTTGVSLGVRIETVNSSGNPSGTLWGTNTNASQTINDTDDNTWFLTQLTADAAVNKGDTFAVVFDNPSGAGELTLWWWIRLYGGLHVPAGKFFQSSVWGSEFEVQPAIMLEYSDSSRPIVQGTAPVADLTFYGFDSGTTPDERGIIFTMPFRCRARGAWMVGLPNAGGTYRLRLYDTDGSATLAQTASLDGDVKTHASNFRSAYVEFASSVELQAGSTYRLTLLPETTGNDVGLLAVVVDQAAHLDAWPGGQAIHHTHRTNAGAWTQVTTERPVMGLVLDQVDDGAGGGSGWFAGE
jgi:hypothetical protein